jgi:hypothetical protein
LAAYGLWHAGIDLRNAVPKVRAFFRPSAPAGSAAPGATFSIPTPQIIESSWVYGHRLKLRWNSTGPTHRYRIYWTSRKGDDTRELSPIAVKTPGAIVQASRFLGAGVITVRATDPEDRESSPSKGILFDPEPVNDKDSVEPLPMEGAAGSSVEAGGGVRESGGGKQPLLKKDFPSPASRLPAPAPTLQPPTEVHVDVRTPNSIRLSWRPVAKDVRYNVYSSGSRQLTGLRKENEAPLKSNAVEWIPETGLDRYWIVVTTLASDGRESAYSEAVEVIRYPEKTGRSAGDEAAGVLRKVLPW